METWRNIKYTMKQKKKEMKINTASTGLDQFYFKIKFKKICYDFLSLNLLKRFLLYYCMYVRVCAYMYHGQRYVQGSEDKLREEFSTSTMCDLKNQLKSSGFKA